MNKTDDLIDTGTEDGNISLHAAKIFLTSTPLGLSQWSDD